MSESPARNRWFVVLGAILIQLCLGAIYAWGVFTPTLQAKKTELVALLSPSLLQLSTERTDEIAQIKARIKELEASLDERGTDPAASKAELDELTAALARLCETTVDEVPEEVWAKHHFEFTGKKTSAVFSAGLFSFAFVMILAGRWQDKVGPRLVAAAGGTVLGAGYILAAFAGTNFWAIFSLIGVVGGAGIGLGYVCPIAACVKWFPDMKGFITGCAVAGFGAGAFFFIQLGGAWGGLIASHGVNFTFLVFGIIFFVCVVLGALLLSNPPAGWKPTGWEPPAPRAGAKRCAIVDLTQGQSVRTLQFWMIWLAFAFSAGCGLMVIQSLKNFGVKEGGLSVAAAGHALGLLALFNGLGRIVWGTASQKLTARGALVAMTVLQAVMMFVLLGMGSHEITLAIAGCWIGFNFGGNLALFPLLTAENFGTKNLGANYGAVFTAYGIGGIAGPMLAGSVWDWAGSYYWAFIPAGVACLLATTLILLLRPPRLITE